ncbi:MAG: PIN domain-containing protein, partial [Nitrospiria bacterium]
CFDDANLDKKKKAVALMESLWESANGVLSLQVLKEFFVTVTKKLSPAMDFAEAKSATIDLLSWNVFLETGDSFEKSLEIVEKYKVSFWDANILSAAILSDSHQLFTEDMQHGQIIEGVKIVNPFL